ncbi:MAG: S-adenosylmethionine:tRNA ribosyltransferase-isomerase [Acidobacteriota bacterium]
MNTFDFTVNHAVTSQRRYEGARLLSIDVERSVVQHLMVGDLPDHFRAGDILVVNDAATLPSSLSGYHKRSEQAIELRLAMPLTSDRKDISRWRAVLFGEGNWRIPTEKRHLPPEVLAGDFLDFAGGLKAKIISVHQDISRRFIDVEFVERGSNLWRKFYRVARPIQYSYLKEDLALWDQQTLFAGPPLALEPPSASFVLTWDILFQLDSLGVEILSLTHATGLSNTGDERIDRMLPLSEPYRISHNVQVRLMEACRVGKRVVAVGTGVVRALESWAGKFCQQEWSWANLKIDERFQRRVVSGLLTGLHEPEATHLSLLRAFVSDSLLPQAYREASMLGYLWHEYGDVCLIL